MLNTTEMSRNELYELVWSKTLNAVAAEYQISVPVLRQLCMDQAIPVPGFGHKPTKDIDRRMALPERSDESGFEWSAALAKALNALHFPGETAFSFQIPSKLSNPDVLVVAAKNTIKQDHQLYGMEDMLRCGFGELAIRSSKKNLDRALRIMDTLLKAFRHRGYWIASQDKETTISLREVRMRISLRVLTKVLPDTSGSDSRRYETTSKLAFKVDGWLDREWRDGTAPLETHIKEILDHMEVSARDLEKIWEDRKIREREDAEKKRALAAEIRDDAGEQAAFEALLAEAQRWNQFQILDSYLDALNKNTPNSPAFNQWLKWARHRRQVFDPIRQKKFDE